ncbi:MAG: O-antigen ligase family protein [Tumebacillaceae bacterium]
MMQQSLSRRTRDFTYYMLLILSFFGLIDYILRATTDSVPHLSTIVPLWKEGLLFLLYVAFYMRSKELGRFDWKANVFHKLVLVTFIALVLSVISNWIIHPESLDITLKTNYHWVPVHDSLSIAIDGIRVLLEPALYTFVLMALIDDEETIRDMVHAMLIAATAIAIFGIYQKLAGWETPKSWVYAAAEGNVKIRVYSSILNPNALGGVLVLSTPLAIALMFWAKSWAQRLVYGIPALLMMWCLELTLSRGAWFGFIAAIALYTIVTRNKWLAIIGVLGLIIIPFAAPSLVHRVTLVFSPEYINKASDKGRVEFWGRALKIWQRYPIFGTGIGTVGDTVAIVHKVPAATWIDNQYFQLLAETGLVGIAAYLAMIFAPVVQGFRSVFGSKQRDTFLYAVNAGILSCIFGMLVENVTAAILENLIVKTLFWSMIGLLYVGIRLANRKENA